MCRLSLVLSPPLPLLLLLLLVLAATIEAFPPPREVSPRRTSADAVYPVNDGELRAVGPSQRYHPMLHYPSRQSAMEENFSPSGPPNRPHVSAVMSKISFGIAGNPLSLHDHEKILNNNNSRSRGGMWRPVRNATESLQGQRNPLSRTTRTGINLRIQNREPPILTDENQRPEYHASHPESVGRRAAGDIVFPDKAMNFTPKEDVKNCSQDWSNVCVTNVQDYPYRHIEQVLTNSAYDFRSFFTDDYIDVATRIDVDANDDSVCDSDETVLYPKVGQTADDQTLFIVNNDGNYKQGVRVEKCRKKDQSPCDPKLVVPTGYRTYCKQKYIYRKLLALQPNGDPVPDNFRIPSCCSCYISKDLASFRSLLKPKDQLQTAASVIL